MKFLRDQYDLIAVLVLVFVLATPAPMVAFRLFAPGRLERNLHLLHYEQPITVIVHE